MNKVFSIENHKVPGQRFHHQVALLDLCVSAPFSLKQKQLRLEVNCDSTERVMQVTTSCQITCHIQESKKEDLHSPVLRPAGKQNFEKLQQVHS